MSVCSIEDVAEHVPEKPFWFQLYVMQDEGFVDELIERRGRPRCSALVLTLDLQILGQRHKDLKNGLSTPPRLTVPNMLDFATRVRWSLGMARTTRRSFATSSAPPERGRPRLAVALGQRAVRPQARLAQGGAHPRQVGAASFVIKGILDPEDARLAVKCGADAIVVSNHGGRQLDGALSTIRVLPSILRAVKGETEVWLDGGIRSGQDVLKAIALGADGTMIGRAYVHGLGAMGEAGVTRALEVIAKEMDFTMALAGRRDIRTVDRDILLVPRDFEGEWAGNR
jgi:L-lactate dehydrogenase (cytochrome)